MNKKQKEEQYKLFADAFHEVVVPLFENTASKEDMEDIKSRLDRVETKIDKIACPVWRYMEFLSKFRYGKIINCIILLII